MSLRFKTAALIGKFNSAGIAEPLLGLAQFLAGRGLEVAIEAETARNTGMSQYRVLRAEDIGAVADVVVAVGGDGTMLSIGRMIAASGVPLIGVNQGRLGFMTDIALADMYTTLVAMLEGEFDPEDRTLIEAEVWREGIKLMHTQALNDVVVSRGAVGGMIELSVSIDGHFVSNQRSDGLILATPTGSTAYALSASGPILDPRVDGFVLVPVAPHALTNRPIVVSDSSMVEVRVIRGKGSRVHFDGQSDVLLDDGDRVVLCRSEHSLRLLHPRGYNYFAMLRQKLHWGTQP
jgi:NAD+ kinase